MKGKSRSGGKQLARYLLTEAGGQRVKLLEQRGSVATDLRAALDTWELEALSVSRGKKALYHMHLRLAPGERLQPSQWFETIQDLEQRLGLTEQPRAIVAHTEGGDTHLHVVYSRLLPSGKLLNMGNDHAAHHAAARSAEIRYGLRRVDSTPKTNRRGNDRTRSIDRRMQKRKEKPAKADFRKTRSLQHKL